MITEDQARQRILILHMAKDKRQHGAGYNKEREDRIDAGIRTLQWVLKEERP